MKSIESLLHYTYVQFIKKKRLSKALYDLRRSKERANPSDLCTTFILYFSSSCLTASAMMVPRQTPTSMWARVVKWARLVPPFQTRTGHSIHSGGTRTRPSFSSYLTSSQSSTWVNITTPATEKPKMRAKKLREKLSGRQRPPFEKG